MFKEEHFRPLAPAWRRTTRRTTHNTLSRIWTSSAQLGAWPLSAGMSRGLPARTGVDGAVRHRSLSCGSSRQSGTPPRHPVHGLAASREGPLSSTGRGAGVPSSRSANPPSPVGSDYQRFVPRRTIPLSGSPSPVGSVRLASRLTSSEEPSLKRAPARQVSPPSESATPV